MNSTASQSSSSGCVGHSPCEPKSSSDFGESLAEEAASRARLTKTRAVSGLSRGDEPVRQVEARGRAGRRRRAAAATAGTAGATTSAAVVQPVAARQDADRARRGGDRDQRPAAASSSRPPSSASWAAELARGRLEQRGDPAVVGGDLGLLLGVRVSRGDGEMARTFGGRSCAPAGLRAVVAERRNLPI